MIFRGVLLIVVAVIMLAGCSRPTADEYYTRADAALRQAHAAADTMADRHQAAKLFEPAIEAFQKVVEEYPGTPRAEEAQFTLASIRNNETQEPELAIKEYKKYLQDFPAGKQAPLALFLVGYLYNNELHQLDSAASTYRQFLEKYPDNEMATSAQQELQSLGKTPEQLLQERQAMEDRAAAPSAGKPAPKKTGRTAGAHS